MQITFFSKEVILRFFHHRISLTHLISGKSAVVAAVQLCLGASARSTGRGSNLAGLIREGCDGPAIMRITLLNEGNDAYKPNVYGKRLTVERRIARKGGGGYRLPDEKNVVRKSSTKN